MEQNLPVIAKRLWSIVRVMFFMLRKGISKKKFMLDFNMMMKRGKIAGKALGNLMFHVHQHLHHHHNHNHSSSSPHEYEFSCSNSPAFPFHFHSKRHGHSHFFSCAHAPQTHDDETLTVNAVKKVLEMLNSNNSIDQAIMSGGGVEASPALPGFGRSPMMVRQLRITDSPFPLNNADEVDNHVDEAAEEFIKKFYKDLKKQRSSAASSPKPW